MIDPKKLEIESQLFTVLGQPTRLKLLYKLRDGEKCVCNIHPAMKEDQSVVSRHLIKLRRMGLLSSRKEGVSVYYSIAEPRVFRLLEMADDILRDLAQKHAREVAGAL
ncbi:MAG: metalloregulator ArsR/SmtB family transcription factor [Candidatus Electryonea clarkiae]|nr:metalloregulator ArsR/SmtB family transcription factor [Candidatus Electryonea clarkiae]MDP8286244.1 metalloregulator ArsR/SmtB family transcription factor [Candidatus Electryonea clarkiae]